jgi:hypothetical protein
MFLFVYMLAWQEMIGHSSVPQNIDVDECGQ